MRTQLRIAMGIVTFLFLIGFFGFVMPSLIGLIITILLIISITDIFDRRYRQAARTFNSAARAVCHQDGAITKVAMAFARSGALRGPCYEYARRLTAGEDPVEAANRSRVPLQLTTAVAMKSGRATPPAGDMGTMSKRSPYYITPPHYAAVLPAYAHIMYLVLTAFITCAVLGFISVFIVPTMEQMMGEFGLATPHYWLIVGSTPTQAILTILVLILLLVTPIIGRGSFFGIPVPRWMPVAPRSVEDKADTLHGLADAIDAGMTVDQALLLGSQVSLVPSQRKSLSYANSLIRQGVSPAESLQRSGWLSARESDWLRGTTAQRGAELLHSLAQQRVRDAYANIRWFMGIVFPMTVVLLGLAVLAYTYGFFGTLVALINGLA
ncbi:MAG: type II secretion system F family protein [Pirellulaceae bacterium]|nr:type II secretion system F family protein [Pirellulaceae bacterium]